MDVNGLKRVNDTLGHKAGDRLIVSVADKLFQYLPGGEVYRTGGDEFIVFCKNISETEFQYICYLCKIDEIVKKRPLRYETYISPDENNLSGGEKQRIILARALLNKFNILILDEALSEVDRKLELNIIKNIRRLYKDKTIIYISHKMYPKIFDNIITFGDKLCHI